MEGGTLVRNDGHSLCFLALETLRLLRLVKAAVVNTLATIVGSCACAGLVLYITVRSHLCDRVMKVWDCLWGRGNGYLVRSSSNSRAAIFMHK